MARAPTLAAWWGAGRSDNYPLGVGGGDGQGWLGGLPPAAPSGARAQVPPFVAGVWSPQRTPRELAPGRVTDGQPRLAGRTAPTCPTVMERFLGAACTIFDAVASLCGMLLDVSACGYMLGTAAGASIDWSSPPSRWSGSARSLCVTIVHFFLGCASFARADRATS